MHNELAWKKGKELTTSSVGEFTLSSTGRWKLFTGKIKPIELLNAESASDTEIKKWIKQLESLTIQSIALNESELTLKFSGDIFLTFYKSNYGFFTLVSNEKQFISYEDNAPYAHYAMV